MTHPAPPRAARRRVAAAALLALAAPLALAGCGGDSGAELVRTGADTPQRGGTLVYATDREPNCLDPHNNGDMPQTYVARQYLDSLVSLQKDGSVKPWLATSWKISADGKRYDFTLKKGVKFTDGTNFDADAVVAKFRQILDPEPSPPPTCSTSRGISTRPRRWTPTT